MAYILRLPAEILFLLFELLGTSDIKALRNVSRRMSRVAAHYQFGRVVLWDDNGRQRIKRGVDTLGSYMERTRALHIHAKLPIKRELDASIYAQILARPNKLTHLLLSHPIDNEKQFAFAFRPLPRLGVKAQLPGSALAHLTHLKLCGIRLTDPDILRGVPLLEELALDLTLYVKSPKELYCEPDAFSIVECLRDACQNLRGLILSVDDASPAMLERIAQQLPNLTSLHFVGAANNDFVPVPSIYVRCVNENIYVIALVLSQMQKLQSLSLPYFLSDDLLPGWHATQNPFTTQTTFYLAPPSETFALQNAVGGNGAGAEAPFAGAGPAQIDGSGLVPTHVYFPRIRDACEVLKQSCPMLESISWCAPSMCYIPEVAVVGPFGLRVSTWSWEPSDEGGEEDMEGEMDDGSVIGGGPPDGGVQQGMWVVTRRPSSELDAEFGR